MGDETNNVIEADMNIIMKIPRNTVRLEATISFFGGNGEVLKAAKVYDVEEINQCRQDFLDNVEFGDDYDASFVLTDLGMEYLESLGKQGD